MQFFFPLKSVSEVIVAIEAALKEADLPVDVKLGADEGLLLVTLSKWGTSKLRFRPGQVVYNDVEGFLFELASEEIASLHKPYIEDVKKAIIDLVVKSGGTT